MNNGYLSLRGLLDEAELRQRSDAVVETDFRDDHAVLDLENGRAREPHLAARVGGERSHQEVAKDGTGMRAAAHPLADDVAHAGSTAGAYRVRRVHRRWQDRTSHPRSW
jgi:hypothetical protein